MISHKYRDILLIIKYLFFVLPIKRTVLNFKVGPLFQLFYLMLEENDIFKLLLLFYYELPSNSLLSTFFLVQGAP